VEEGVGLRQTEVLAGRFVDGGGVDVCLGFSLGDGLVDGAGSPQGDPLFVAVAGISSVRRRPAASEQALHREPPDEGSISSSGVNQKRSHLRPGSRVADSGPCCENGG